MTQSVHHPTEQLFLILENRSLNRAHTKQSIKEVFTYQRDLHFCLHIDQKTNKQNIELRKIESTTHILWIDMEFLNLATILRHRNATFTIVVSFHGHWERTQPL